MSFLTNLAKDFGKSVINQAQRMNEWKQEADMLNDEELVRRLNNYLPGQKKNAYMLSAKERGTMGRRDGEFYVRY